MTKKIKEKQVEALVAERAKGASIKDLAGLTGTSITTVRKLLKEKMSPVDYEDFQKAKKLKFAEMIAQQIDIQSRPEIAEHNAIRFGAGNIVNLEKAAAIAEGRFGENDTGRQIQVNIQNLYAEFNRLEEEKKTLIGMGEVIDATLEGPLESGDQQKHLNAGT